MNGPSSPLPRRFYKAARVTGQGTAFGVALDGRPLRTPLKSALTLPTGPLAEAVAAEWQAQGERIDPFSMPLTRLANTAIDRVKPDPNRIAAEIAAMAGHDLVCYRAEAPAELVRRQAQAWDPVLDWAMAALDARFAVTIGVVHIDQPLEALAAFRRYVEGQSPWVLTALHNMATLTHSALIAAMSAAQPEAAEAGWRRAHVDEDWQIENWGEDEEAQARRALRHAEYLACMRLVVLAAI